MQPAQGVAQQVAVRVRDFRSRPLRTLAAGLGFGAKTHEILAMDVVHLPDLMVCPMLQERGLGTESACGRIDRDPVTKSVHKGKLRDHVVRPECRGQFVIALGIR
ncbi:hypothetical protein D3C78_1360160 [compost metagenome]